MDEDNGRSARTHLFGTIFALFLAATTSLANGLEFEDASHIEENDQAAAIVEAAFKQPFDDLEQRPWEIAPAFLPVAPTIGAEISVPVVSKEPLRAEMLGESASHAIMDGGAVRISLAPGPVRTEYVLLASNTKDGPRMVLPVFVGALKDDIRWINSQNISKSAGDGFVLTGFAKSITTGRVASAEVVGEVAEGRVQTSTKIEDYFEDITITALTKNPPDTSKNSFSCLIDGGGSLDATWSANYNTLRTAVIYNRSVANGQPTLYRFVLRVHGAVVAEANQVRANVNGVITCGPTLGGSQSQTVLGVTVEGKIKGVAGLQLEANNFNAQVNSLGFRLNNFDAGIGFERLNDGSWRNLTYLVRDEAIVTLPSSFSIQSFDISSRAGAAMDVGATVKKLGLPLASFTLARGHAGVGRYWAHAAPFDPLSLNFVGPRYGLDARIRFRAFDVGGFATAIFDLPAAPLINIDQRWPIETSPRVTQFSINRNGQLSGTVTKSLLDLGPASGRMVYFDANNVATWGPTFPMTFGAGSTSGSFSTLVQVPPTAVRAAVRIIHALSGTHGSPAQIIQSTTCTSNLSVTNANVAVAGGSIPVDLTPVCTPTPLVSNSASWISATVANAGARVNLQVARNPNTTARTAQVQIAGRSLSVSQAGSSAISCSVTQINPASVSAPASGGDLEAQVSMSAPGCAIPAPTFDHPWAVNQLLTPDGRWTIRVSRNETGATRTTTGRIGTRAITLSQPAMPAGCLVVSMQSDLVALPGPGISNHGVPYTTSPSNCVPAATGLPAWITVAPRNNLAVVDVSPNSTGMERVATIQIGSRPLRIRQPAMTASTFALMSIISPNNAGSLSRDPFSQNLAANTTVVATVSPNPGWQVGNTTYQTSSGNQQLFSGRSFMFQTRAEAGQLLANFNPCQYSAPASVTLPAPNAATPVSVTTNPNCLPGGVSSQPWLTTMVNSANQMVLVAQANAGPARSATVSLINGPTITVTQQASSPPTTARINSASPNIITITNSPVDVVLAGTGLSSAILHAGFGVPNGLASSYGFLTVTSDQSARLQLSPTAQRQFGTLGFAARPLGQTQLPTISTASLTLVNPAPGQISVSGRCRRLLNCGTSADAVIQSSTGALMQSFSVPGNRQGSRVYVRGPGVTAWSEVSLNFSLGGGPNRYNQAVLIANGNFFPTVGTYRLRLCNDVSGVEQCSEADLPVTN